MNKLDYITITGADNFTSPSQLATIANKYPQTEVAILLSKSKMGADRYPDPKWVGAFLNEYVENVAVHICGEWCQKMLMGDFEIMKVFGGIMSKANRFQLNFSPDRSKWDIGKFAKAVKGTRFEYKQFIVQFGAIENSFLYELRANGINAAVLFDASGGRGKKPEGWPLILDGIDCGYAGGLSPETIAQDLPFIAQSAKGNSFWVDVETNIRTNDKFDIAKALHFVQECDAWNKNNSPSK